LYYEPFGWIRSIQETNADLRVQERKTTNERLYFFLSTVSTISPIWPLSSELTQGFPELSNSNNARNKSTLAVSILAGKHVVTHELSRTSFRP
jgi:hypothetical protein